VGRAQDGEMVVAGEFDEADPATWTPFQRERRRHVRDRHEREVAEWVARQQLSQQWVSFAEIADWCAREPGGTKRDEDRRCRAYRDLARAIMAGEFDRAGRWCVVRPPDGHTSIAEPLRFRVTLARLRKWPTYRGGMTVSDQELARWWAPRRLCAAWFRAREISPPPWVSVSNKREQMLSQARAASNFDPAPRRHTVFGLINDGLWSQACTSTEILEEAYGDAEGRAYWEAWLFEPMPVYQFARLLAIHRAAAEVVPTASFNGQAVPMLDGFMRQVFEALRVASHSGEGWFRKLGESGIAMKPADSALSAVAAQMGEGWAVAVLPREAIMWMGRNPNSRHLVPAAAAAVAVQLQEMAPLPPENATGGALAANTVGSTAHVGAAPYRTGLPGRPTSGHLIEGECRRRHAAGERHPKVAEWASVLITWLRSEHPAAPPPAEKTVKNKLSPLLRELDANRPK
jgi:hypothetical protein